MQLTVEKSDGSREIYRHTKVLGSIAMALGDSDQYQAGLAESLAEAVTTYLRRQFGSGSISFDEVHSMIEAALTDTGYEQAAVALHDHHISRQIKRGRIEVVKYDTTPTNPKEIKTSPYMDISVRVHSAQPWNKSVIARDLVEESEVHYDLARTVAGLVEEKVLRMDCRCVSTPLVKELVNCELLAMRQAEVALAGRSVSEEAEKNNGCCRLPGREAAAATVP